MQKRNQSKNCYCQSWKHQQQQKQQLNKGKKSQQVDHIISLIQNNFVSPYKILYFLDPKQADFFKARNLRVGCCSANKITIDQKDLSQTQKLLKQSISYAFIWRNLDHILSISQDRYNNIISSGKKDNLQINSQAQKFVLDKVMSQTINKFIYQKIAQALDQKAWNMNRGMTFWATPQSWQNQYPNIQLNNIFNKSLSQLQQKGWFIQQNLCKNKQNLTQQLFILQKDGKFQESNWIDNVKQVNFKAKILTNIQKYIQFQRSDGKILFPYLKQYFLKISSLPFQLNKKMNLYCTLSPNTHICYSSSDFQTSLALDVHYTVLMLISGDLVVNIQNKNINIKEGQLVIINNKRHKCKIINKNKEQLLLFRNYIQCIQKK